jgi:hypothetical protein
MSQNPPPFNVIKLPMRVQPTVFPSDNNNMSSATSSSAQGRPATAGGPPSQGQGGHTQASSVDSSRQRQRDGQSQSVTVPVDRRATGSALESPVIFDGRRVDGILAGLVEYENQVNALRHRLGGLVRDVHDFYFDNGKCD